MSNVSVRNQFSGLPMSDLIGGPLSAACNAQLQLANATADFIHKVGFAPNPEGTEGKLGPVRTVAFRFDSPSAELNEDGTPKSTQAMTLDVPLLSIVKVPNLAINKIDISFDMEIKSSESSIGKEASKHEYAVDAGIKFSPFSAKVNFSGSVSSSKENTRSSDQSAKYHVELQASDQGMPEGLARVLDIISQSIIPKKAPEIGPKKLDGHSQEGAGAGAGAGA